MLVVFGQSDFQCPPSPGRIDTGNAGSDEGAEVNMLSVEVYGIRWTDPQGSGGDGGAAWINELGSIVDCAFANCNCPGNGAGMVVGSWRDNGAATIQRCWWEGCGPRGNPDVGFLFVRRRGGKQDSLDWVIVDNVVRNCGHGHGGVGSGLIVFDGNGRPGGLRNINVSDCQWASSGAKSGVLVVNPTDCDDWSPSLSCSGLQVVYTGNGFTTNSFVRATGKLNRFSLSQANFVNCRLASSGTFGAIGANDGMIFLGDGLRSNRGSSSVYWGGGAMAAVPLVRVVGENSREVVITAYYGGAISSTPASWFSGAVTGAVGSSGASFTLEGGGSQWAYPTCDPRRITRSATLSPEGTASRSISPTASRSPAPTPSPVFSASGAFQATVLTASQVGLRSVGFGRSLGERRTGSLRLTKGGSLTRMQSTRVTRGSRYLASHVGPTRVKVDVSGGFGVTESFTPIVPSSVLVSAGWIRSLAWVRSVNKATVLQRTAVSGVTAKLFVGSFVVNRTVLTASRAFASRGFQSRVVGRTAKFTPSARLEAVVAPKQGVKTGTVVGALLGILAALALVALALWLILRQRGSYTTDDEWQAPEHNASLKATDDEINQFVSQENPIWEAKGEGGKGEGSGSDSG